MLKRFYELHKRDHELEKDMARKRVRLVKRGNGWVLD